MALLVFLPFCWSGLPLTSHIYSEFRFCSEFRFRESNWNSKNLDSSDIRQKFKTVIISLKILWESATIETDIFFFSSSFGANHDFFHWVLDEADVLLLEEILCEKYASLNTGITQGFMWGSHHKRKWPEKQKMPIFQFTLTPGYMFIKCNCHRNVAFLSSLRKASKMEFAWINFVYLNMCPGILYPCILLNNHWCFK